MVDKHAVRKFVFRFDPAHKTGKVHMEMYKRIKNNVWQPYAECDPITGEVLGNSTTKMAKRPPVKW